MDSHKIWYLLPIYVERLNSPKYRSSGVCFNCSLKFLGGDEETVTFGLPLCVGFYYRLSYSVLHRAILLPFT